MNRKCRCGKKMKLVAEDGSRIFWCPECGRLRTETNDLKSPVKISEPEQVISLFDDGK